LEGRRDNVITTTQHLDHYLDSYSEFEKLAAGRNLPWLRKLRERAFARFCELGFPTTHDEDWRFTNVSPISEKRFRLPPNGVQRVSPEILNQWRTTGGFQLVFVNGQFRPELSQTGALPTGVKVSSLAEEIEKNPGLVEAHLGRYLNIQRDAFCALNTAFAEDGAYVHIRKGTVLEKPIHLLFLCNAEEASVMSHPRNLVIAEEESEAAMVEDYVSLGPGVGFCNTVTELVAGDSAVISHYMIEREHADSFNISTLRIQQGRSANVASHSVLLGGALVRNNVHPVLAGEGGECLINGLFVGNGRQHHDNYMLVEHASPHCGSRQFYNGILDGNARGVFHGRIIVHKDAQKTDAKQTNRNLLLSDNAQIDTKPQLEIYADDVKCTHGATIGQIEENALFYLRSRGIDEGSARKLLLLAFAKQCLDRMKQEPVRAWVEGLINRHLFNAAPASLEPGENSCEETARNWEEIG
jgi:Fe-S cluster assembly protein SufD